MADHNLFSEYKAIFLETLLDKCCYMKRTIERADY
jgi:hypothetical protein